MNPLKVTFIVNESGLRVTKEFDSEWMCRKFLNKVKHSKRVVLVSYPLLQR